MQTSIFLTIIDGNVWRPLPWFASDLAYYKVFSLFVGFSPQLNSDIAYQISVSILMSTKGVGPRQALLF